MLMLSKLLAAIKSMFCSALCVASSLFPMRHDWSECCRNSEETRRAIESMRDECWRTGV
jgi:hypothetical protein